MAISKRPFIPLLSPHHLYFQNPRHNNNNNMLSNTHRRLYTGSIMILCLGLCIFLGPNGLIILVCAIECKAFQVQQPPHHFGSSIYVKRWTKSSTLT